MLQPLRGKILVEVLDDAKRTESGLYLAGVKEEIPHRGLVISLGAPFRDKKQKELLWGFKEGHIVHFKRIWDQQKVKNYVLKRDQIFAIEHEDKAYGFDQYIIVKRHDMKSSGLIILSGTTEVDVEKQIGYCTVISVGREDKLGINVGDELAYYKNEGLAVRIPLQPELWSLKGRAVLARMENNKCIS